MSKCHFHSRVSRGHLCLGWDIGPIVSRILQLGTMFNLPKENILQIILVPFKNLGLNSENGLN